MSAALIQYTRSNVGLRQPIAQRLRQLRREANLTRKDASAQAAISLHSLRDGARGRTTASLLVVERFLAMDEYQRTIVSQGAVFPRLRDTASETAPGGDEVGKY